MGKIRGGGGFFFLQAGGELTLDDTMGLHKEYFQSFEAFVILKLIFHIY